jgi:hypothetical protein
MKSPWQIGLLAIAVTGVSTYDYMFFKNRNAKTTPVAAIQLSSPVSGAAEPLLAPLPESAGSEAAPIGEGGALRPAISLDEVNSLSKQPFVIKEDWESAKALAQPARASVGNQAVAAKPVRGIPARLEINKEPVLNSEPSPRCVFSGTLIDGHKKLALVNGMPLMVGDRLGLWQLARIESDYIVLESGAKAQRIELSGMEIRPMPVKDPS